MNSTHETETITPIVMWMQADDDMLSFRDLAAEVFDLMKCELYSTPSIPALTISA
jgi:hypothetical protein